MMLPHEGCGGCTPTPRKESVASSSTVVATPSVPHTIALGKRCGAMWRNRMRICPAPSERSARMKSRSTSPRVSV